MATTQKSNLAGKNLHRLGLPAALRGLVLLQDERLAALVRRHGTCYACCQANSASWWLELGRMPAHDTTTGSLAEAPMRFIRTALVAIAALLLAPAAASAQGGLTVFVGGNFGGDSGVSLHQSINDTSRLSFGARVGTMTAGILGGEVDIGYTPDFYGKGTVFDSSSVITVMGNGVIAIPAPLVHPYVVAGVGLIRRTISYLPGDNRDNVSDTRAAYAIGGGVHLALVPHIGFSADVRYFRNFSPGNSLLDLEDETFGFVRASVGIGLRF